MSRIYFDSQQKSSEVSGRERAHMGVLIGDLLEASIGPVFDYPPDQPHWTRLLLPKDHYLHNCGTNYDRSLMTYLHVSSGELIINGEPHPIFDIGLNTALAMGGDAVKLAARFHGQCEVHCYVEGRNRCWIAQMIADACEASILRIEEGWQAVIDHLQSIATGDKGPVVCSYSVCERFPYPSICGWTGEEEGWYDLPRETQWAQGLEFIRRQPGLELKPEDWDKISFGKGVTGFQLEHLALRKEAESE